MLRRLSVSNYILIDSLEIEFDPRLNIITGETGAGKSILLGALGLLLGNKNEGAALRDTQRNCVIEGVFDIAAYGLRPFFEANDLDYADEAVVRAHPNSCRQEPRLHQRPAGAARTAARVRQPGSSTSIRSIRT